MTRNMGFVLLVGFILLISRVLACFPADSKVEAAAGYAAQQLACVDTYADKHNIDACRAKVRAAWAVTDAGKDGDQ
jgi:hypothetical protein